MGTDHTSDMRATDAERTAALDRNLMGQAEDGWRTESRGAFQATIVKGKRVNHVLHVILSVLSLGLWLPIWLIVALVGGEKRFVLTVDEFGKVRETRV